MMPMPYRFLASMAVKLNGQIYIFDAGEGTQIGVKKVRLGVRNIRVFAITHLHADHCLGLPGLLMLRSQMEEPGPVTIIGPPGIEEFVRQTRRMLEFHINYPILFMEWSDRGPEVAYEDEQVRIRWQPLAHTRFCLGYRFEEKERSGKFDPLRAEKLGVPRGPLWGRLQKYEKVVLENGTEISPEQVMDPPRRGRHVAYVVDTRPTGSIRLLCREVDIAFIEGMFLPEHADQAEAKAHMTILEAAALARMSKVRRAVLTHISPRYDERDLQIMETALWEDYGDFIIGRDFQRFTIPYND
jgi:ribonuclease Z